MTSGNPDTARLPENGWWPEISDLKSASRAARQGIWAALWAAGGIILLALLSGATLAQAISQSLIDVLVFVGVAIGAWKRLRTTAVLGLLWFVAGVIFTAISRSGPWGAVSSVVLGLAFVNSLRGSFAYRAFLKCPEPARPRYRFRFALIIYSGMRTFRAGMKRVFPGKEPHWAQDLLEPVVSRVNAIQLVPTIWAILFFPAHFFCRVPQMLTSRPSGCKSPYRTPVGLGTRLIALTFAADQLLYHRLVDHHLPFEHQDQRRFALFCLALPVILAVVSLLFWCLIAPIGFAWRYIGLYLNPAHLLVVVDPVSYSRMRVTPRLWGFVYYYAYALCVPQIAALFAGDVLYYSVARTGVDTSAMSGSLMPLLIALVLLLDRVFIQPYAELLRACAAYPTRRMHLSDVQRLANALSHAEYLLKQIGSARKKERLERTLATVLGRGARNAWLVLKERIRQDRLIEMRLDTHQVGEFLNERAQAYRHKSFAAFERAWASFPAEAKARYEFIDEMLGQVRAAAAGNSL